MKYKNQIKLTLQTRYISQLRKEENKETYLTRQEL